MMFLFMKFNCTFPELLLYLLDFVRVLSLKIIFEA